MLGGEIRTDLRQQDPAAGAAGPLCFLAAAIAALCAIVPLALRASGALDALWGADVAGQGLILLCTFLLAGLVGAQFPLAAAAGAGTGPVAARLFSADLAGACVGAFLVSSLLIPIIGLPGVCLLTAGLNGAAAALPWARRP